MGFCPGPVGRPAGRAGSNRFFTNISQEHATRAINFYFSVPPRTEKGTYVCEDSIKGRGGVVHAHAGVGLHMAHPF